MIRWCAFSLVAALLFLAGCSKSTPFALSGTVPEISADLDTPIEPVPAAEFGPDDWPWWRGPNRDGTAVSEQVPLEWSETENIVWRVPIPGRGHSSPTVVGDRIYLATADERRQVQAVLSFDRESGEQVWKADVHTGGFPRLGVHHENSHASCTVACDGERLFVAFLNQLAIWVTALDLDGHQLWQTNVGPLRPEFGYAASPAIYRSLVILAVDHPGGGYLAALQRANGKIYWRKARPAMPSYSSPVVVSIAGKDQLLISGCYLVASYDPNTGNPLWSCQGTTKTTCGTMVFQDDLVFASGGHPGSDTVCVRADGSGDVVWRTNQKAYVPSMLVHDGYLYAVDGELGIVYCWQSDTGRLAWRKRLQPRFRSSPILAGDYIFLPNARGKTYVFRATPEKFHLIAENQLGDEIYATPVICGGRIYLRVADHSTGTRRETLYCIGRAGQ